MKPRPTSNSTRISASMIEAQRKHAPKRTVKEWAAEYGTTAGYVYQLAGSLGLTGFFGKPSEKNKVPPANRGGLRGER